MSRFRPSKHYETLHGALEDESAHVRHLRLPRSAVVKIDGRVGDGVIFKP